MKHEGEWDPRCSECGDQPRCEPSRRKGKRIVLENQPIEPPSRVKGVRESLHGLRLARVEATDHVNAGRFWSIVSDAAKDNDFLILVSQLLREPPAVIADSIELRGKGSRENGNSHCGTDRDPERQSSERQAPRESAGERGIFRNCGIF